MSMGPFEVDAKPRAEARKDSSERGPSSAVCASSFSLVFSCILLFNFIYHYSEASNLGDSYICVAEPICSLDQAQNSNYASAWKAGFGWAIACFLFMILAAFLMLSTAVAPQMS